MYLFLVLVIAVSLTGLCSAALVAPTEALIPDANIQINNVLLDNQQYLFGPLPGFDTYQGIHYESSISGAIAHSGSASYPYEKITYQHVFAFGTEESDIRYEVDNTAGHRYTYLLDEADFGKAHGRNARATSEVSIFDGSLLLALSPNQKNQRGLLASFEFVTKADYKIYRNQKSRRKSITLLKGSIKLIGLKNGKIKIKTSGVIRKNHIASVSNENGDIIEQEVITRRNGTQVRRPIKARDINMIMAGGDLFRIDLDGLDFPVSFCMQVDSPYTITTEMTSMVSHIGDDSGSEVIFIPGVTFNESGTIPEPATFVLLSLGALFMLKRKPFSFPVQYP